MTSGFEIWGLALRSLGWLGVNVLLLYGSSRFCALWGRLKGSELAVATGVVVVCWVILTEIILGSLGHFKFLPVAGGLLVFGLAMAVGKPWIAGKCQILGFEGLYQFLWLFLATATLAHLGSRFFVALTLPPSNWDSLWYHLPTIWEWLKSNNISVSYEIPYWHHPHNSELLLAWFILPFQSNLLVNLYNFPLLIWLGCSAWLLSKRLGMSETWRWFFIFSLMNMTIIGSLMLGSQKNDLLLLALFIGSLSLLTSLGFEGGNDQCRLLLSAFAGGGMLVGTKLNGLIYSPLLLLLLLFFKPFLIQRYLIYFSCGLPLAFFWILKIWMLTGKPFLSFDPNPFPGGEAGLASSSLLFSLRSLKDFQFFIVDLFTGAGWWPLWGVGVAVVFLFRPVSQLNWTISLLSLVCLIIFLATPLTHLVLKGHSIVRLGFPYVVLSTLIFFTGLDRLANAWASKARSGLQWALTPLILAPSGIPHEIFHRIFVSPRGIFGAILFFLALFFLFVRSRRLRPSVS